VAGVERGAEHCFRRSTCRVMLWDGVGVAWAWLGQGGVWRGGLWPGRRGWGLRRAGFVAAAAKPVVCVMAQCVAGLGPAEWLCMRQAPVLFFFWLLDMWVESLMRGVRVAGRGVACGC